ncbi:hypothetical protein HRW14_07405 [Streptomyces lunaelactis]|uniref:hypothetical protein n=1 Tax=Streptomyces lunaelactis TaxID=1535768 RepID=UPI0015857C53|nr:hypothetical protein [Streptomyces lunaelactis]NUK50126.1 hypothetical protein [Streptomyces lunaelactis]
MTIETEAARLLLTLNIRTGGDTMYIWNAAGDPDWRHVDDERIATLIEYLNERRLADNYRTFASGTACRITAAGVAQAEKYAEERDDPRRRFDFAADSLIRAAMKEYPRTRIELGTFVGTEHMWFYDRVLELAEVQRAVDFLEQKSLVSVERSAVQALAISLTPLGAECGFQDPIYVRNFLNEQQRDNGPSIIINGNGNQIGDNNTQNNTFGYDPSQLAQFARELLAAANAADIPDDARAEIVVAGGALQQELDAASPEPGRVRQLWDSFVQSARQNLPSIAWTTVAAAAGIPMG